MEESKRRLKGYKRVFVYKPEQISIRRWINMDERRIYINIAAPDGKIDQLIFGKEDNN